MQAVGSMGADAGRRWGVNEGVGGAESGCLVQNQGFWVHHSRRGWAREGQNQGFFMHHSTAEVQNRVFRCPAGS